MQIRPIELRNFSRKEKKAIKNFLEKIEQAKEAKKYKQALDEIKENISDEYCCDLDCGCNDKEECLLCTRDRILDIINATKG